MLIVHRNKSKAFTSGLYLGLSLSPGTALSAHSAMDFKAKTKLIEAIDDEVNILHRLLHDTFRQMEGIEEVEYTHGPHEKGADFVLTRRDPALGRTHEIGIIAKRGKILSNADDVFRQVEECQMPRTIRGGKDHVRLSEVWVVNTASISQQAQERINHKFSGQRIEFIDGEKLTELVDQHAPYFWHEIKSEVGAYLHDLSSRITQTDRECSVVSGLGCDDFYIAPEIQEIEKVRYASRNRRSTKHRLVNILEEIFYSKVNFLEGEMGFGKSKTARSIVKHFCAPDRYKHHPVLPVFATFREMVDSGRSLAEQLSYATFKFFNFNELKGVTVLFVIDGVDEVIGRCPKWDQLLTKLADEAKAAESFRILFTSRPLKKIDEEVTIYAGARRFLLRQLSMGKLVEFITKACEKLSVPKRLFEDLQRSDLFKQLPHSPIAAALLSRLIAQNSNDLPSNLTELYSKSVENLLGRWDITKGGCTEKEYRDAERVSLDLADYIIGNQLIYISADEARQRITDWHKERNTDTNLNTLLERVFEKSGLFAIDPESGILSFRHRSFGEYLHALSGYKRHRLLPAERAFEPYWINIQFFQTGLLGDCEEHLNELLSVIPQTEVGLWLKILVMPDYFLAGYQTRYSVVEENLYKLFIDAANLFDQAKHGKTETRLAELSEMHLLWFFQRLVRNCYEYEFFRKAITGTLLKIDQEVLPDQIRHLALFFAACFAAELNDGSGFEYLVKTYGVEKLPLAISLAIKIEQSSNKNFGKLPLLKDHERKLNHLLKPAHDQKIQSISQNSAISDLFDKPVKVRHLS